MNYNLKYENNVALVCKKREGDENALWKIVMEDSGEENKWLVKVKQKRFIENDKNTSGISIENHKRLFFHVYNIEIFCDCCIVYIYIERTYIRAFKLSFARFLPSSFSSIVLKKH